MKGLLNKQLEQKVLANAQIHKDVRTNLFNLKGETIKIILLINSKYKEDFDEYLESFTKEIWANCLENNQSTQGKIVTYSIKYFKSFASNEKYYPLFQQKMKDILVGLVIPNYSPIEDDFDVFESESQNFVENLFSLMFRSVNTEREAIQEFVFSLGKFHSETLMPLLAEMQQSLFVSQNISMDGLLKRVTFMNLLISSSSFACNIREGIISILCPHNLVTSTFDSIALPMVSILLNSMDSNPVQKLFVLCQVIRFMNMFRYFLDSEKLYQVFQVILEKNLQSNQKIPGIQSFEKRLFTWGTNLLNLKTFTVEDKTNINHQGMNFYQKYYVNPRVLKIKVDRKKYSLANNHQVLSVICQSLYSTFTTDQSEIQEQTLTLFKTCLVRLDQNVLQFLDHLLKIYEGLIERIISDKIHMNFGLINEIFESFGSLIQLSSANPSSAEKIMLVLSRVPELFKKNVCEMHSLVIQVMTVFIRSFAVNVAPTITQTDCHTQPNKLSTELFQKSALSQIVMSCIDEKNYQGELLKLNEIYLHLLSQCSFMCPGLIFSEWKSIEKLLKFLIKQQMHISVTGFLRDLIIARVAFPDMMTFIIEYITMMTQMVVDAQNMIELQIFYREMTLLLVNFIDINNIQNFIQIFTQMNAMPVLQKFFSHPHFVQFLSTFSGSINRKYLILMFTRFLFEQPQEIMNVLTFPVYREILNALVGNEYRRKFNYKSMRMSRTDSISFKRRLAKRSGGVLGNVYFFKILRRPHRQRIQDFLEMTQGMVEESGSLLINKLKECINNGMFAQEFL